MHHGFHQACRDRQQYDNETNSGASSAVGYRPAQERFIINCVLINGVLTANLFRTMTIIQDQGYKSLDQIHVVVGMP